MCVYIYNIYVYVKYIYTHIISLTLSKSHIHPADMSLNCMVYHSLEETTGFKEFEKNYLLLDAFKQVIKW